MNHRLGAILLVVHFTVNTRNICKQCLFVFTRVLLSLVIASYLAHKNKFYLIVVHFCLTGTEKINSNSLHACMFVSVCKYLYTHTYIYTCIFAYMYAHIYMYVYTCLYVYVKASKV